MLRASTAVLALGGLLLLLVTIASSPAQAQDVTSIGIDVSPNDNTATSLGRTDSCVAVSKGDSFRVDVFVQNVEDLLAWEAYLSFDPDHLRVIDRDGNQFLAAIPEGSPFDISASVPNDDGRYRVGAANIADPPRGGSGSGVLARLTLEAKEQGMVTLSLAPIETEVGSIGPTLTAVDGSQIGDSDDDSFFDGPIADARVAIDESCPGGDAGGAAADISDGDGDGVAWWLIVIVAVTAVAIASLGGIAILARRRTRAG